MDLLFYWGFGLLVTISSTCTYSKKICKGAKFVIIKWFETQILAFLSKCYSSWRSLTICGWRRPRKAGRSALSTAALRWFSWATSYKLWYKIGPVNLENCKGKSSIALIYYTWVPMSSNSKAKDLTIYKNLTLWTSGLQEVSFSKMRMV